MQEEEDEKDRHSSIGGDSQPCPSPVRMEGCGTSVSDVSMAEEGLQQGDSDVVVEEEVEENMETDEPPNVEAPAPTPIKPSRRLLSLKLRMIAEAMSRKRVRTRTRPTTRTSTRTSFWGRPPMFPYPEGTRMIP